MKECSQKIVFALSFFLMLAAPLVVWAVEHDRETRLQDGGTSYSRGDYAAAIQSFESLIPEGKSAPLFYNLANSYAQAGQSGRAILNYERALRLKPGDPDIRGNLELVRKDKGLFQEEQSFVQRFVGILGLNQWLVLAATASVLFAGVLLLPASVALKRSSRYGIAAACLIITVIASTGVVRQNQHWHDGVVVAVDARLRVSPFESAASVGVIQEGRLVSPGKIHNDYVLVVDETGRSGWLSSDAFELIATP
jgi:Tetratricopeptide repeat